MVCSACRRKVDPKRSFCPACGSAAFVEEPELVERDASQVLRADVDATPPTPAERPRSSRRRKPDRASTPVQRQSLGCFGCLVRLIAFGAVIWYGGRWLLSIPEVQSLVDALLSGSFSDDQIAAAIDAVRAQILQWLGASTSSP
jgi:hypothetical protein